MHMTYKERTSKAKHNSKEQVKMHPRYFFKQTVVARIMVNVVVSVSPAFEVVTAQSRARHRT